MSAGGMSAGGMSARCTCGGRQTDRLRQARADVLAQHLAEGSTSSSARAFTPAELRQTFGRDGWSRRDVEVAVNDLLADERVAISIDDGEITVSIAPGVVAA